MREKILLLMKKEGLTSSRLAELLGTGPSNISHILSGRSRPGYDLLRQIVLRFPRINPDWLLDTSDQMYRPETDMPPIDSSGDHTQLKLSVESPVQDSASHQSESTTNDVRNSPEIPTAISSTVQAAENEIRKIIVIYADHSFESFIPRK